VVTFSPKVFIPLTRLCRDFCGYCTFRQSPQEADKLFMSLEDVLMVAEAGERAGCTEALFTLGERPEQRYPEAHEWLRIRGYATTIDYLHDVCESVISKTLMLPHPNPGTMSRREMSKLKQVSASMGIMLESVSDKLWQQAGPHQMAPSKRPRVRLKTIQAAGELRIPFTTGILIGIGETREERVESVLAIREMHQRYGHIQEVIIQNFLAKPDTPMAWHKDATTEELLWSVAMARILLGPHMNIQVPPNLSYRDYPIFLLAGINDWGGISPITIDYVNPEAPWPQLQDLKCRTEELGFTLKPRLPIYPEYILGGHYLPPSLGQHIKSLADENGYVKGGIDRYAK
jgi:7,8-didemethyl-8-hydroxy-5-deazariboflavin synthase CofG subunit